MSLLNRRKDDPEKPDKRKDRREFRLDKIIEKTQLMIAKAARWKWLAAVIGVALLFYLAFTAKGCF